MEGIQNSIAFTSDGNIGISPSDNQLKKWTLPLQINGKTVNTPIGVTGLWYPWPKAAKNYKMEGMSGCTGVIIVVCRLYFIDFVANIPGQHGFLGWAFLGILCT
jgi:hypothetical protein